MKANNPKSNSRKRATTTPIIDSAGMYASRRENYRLHVGWIPLAARPELGRQQQNSIQSSQTFYTL